MESKTGYESCENCIWNDETCSHCIYCDDYSLWESKEKISNPAATSEPMPAGNGKVVITEVIRDLLDRDEIGQKKYGTNLRLYNGRDALMDAYQEACDMVMYLKQALMERSKK